ncbi:hypothetical protein Bbelb_038240 [Branchiostoma belcheri]|nr:hypothetical protein Bbelb_038240 [Branchiostoma belcheri]
MHTAIGLFDLEDAYNKVDIAILVRKMREMGISDIITRWGAYLATIQNMLHEIRNLALRGIPEGTGATQHEALVELQVATNKLEGWTIANHMSIQPEKSAWKLASLGHPNADLKLKYAGSEVKRENKTTLTRCAPSKAVEALQRIENQAMRLVTGAARSTSCEALRHWLGIHSIRDRQTIMGAKEFLRIANTPSHTLHQEIVTRQDEAIPQRLITVNPGHGSSSSYRSECEAMEDALIWLTENTDEEDCHYFTDSYSLKNCRSRHNGPTTWSMTRLEEKGIKRGEGDECTFVGIAEDL